MENKKNDWFATLLFQPNMTLQDFANNDITPENTSLNSRDYYKTIPQVTEAFTKDGKFDETKFNNFYQSALDVYNTYSNSEFENKLLETFEYDPFDYFAPAGSKVKDNLPEIKKVPNPERRSSGLENLFGKGQQTMSVREIAQQNKVFNYETQKFEDWSPNEKGGFWKALHRPTLVLATWDEDGEHTVDNRIIQHKKGDLKFNSEGDTYYETLGDREIYGKQVLGIEDTLTTDGSAWNKYDFFDSDGLDKSLTGTVAKLVFKVGPMLIPYVGAAYGALSASTELAQLIPTIMKSINGIITNDNNSDFIKSLNKIEGYAARFNTNVSDYSQQHMISWENLGKMIEDTSLQLFQQRVIGEIPRILTGAPESLKVQKLGRNLSLAYMAGTSSQQAYSEFKQAGATDAVAGLGMLSVMGGMYGLMNMDYFRNMLFRNTYLDQNPSKKAVKALADEVNSNITKWSTATPKEAAGFIAKGRKFFQDQFKKYSEIEIVDQALNEATEEVMEEFSSDLTKALFAAGSALGLDMTESNKKLDFGWSARDAAQRYAMSFFGGAIGGPVFHLHGKWQNRLHGISNNLATSSDHQTAQEIVYLIRQGRTEDIKNVLSKLHRQGKLGNTNLSGKTYEIVDNGTEKQIKFHNAEIGESQNDVVYDQLMDYIDRVDLLISSEGLKISDDVLKKLQVAENEGQLLDPVAEAILDSGVTTQIFSDFNDISENLLRKSAELSKITSATDTEAETPKANEEREQINSQSLEVQKLTKEINELRAKRDAILNGERTGYYYGQALFASNNAINKAFINIGLHNYTLSIYGKDYESLSDDLKKTVEENFKEYSQLEEKQRVFKGYDLFLGINEKLSPLLTNINNQLTDRASNDVYNIQSSVIGNLGKRISEIDSKLTTLSNAEDSKSHAEEIANLNVEKQRLLAIQNQYTTNLGLFISNPVTPKGQEILHRPTFMNSNNVNIDQYGQSILDFYNYLRENNIPVDLGDTDVNILIKGLKDAQSAVGATYKQRYLKWLEQQYEIDPYFDSGREDFNIISGELVGVGDIQTNDLLDELESELGNRNEIALLKYNEIISLLKQAELSDEEMQSFIDYVFPKIGEQSIGEYLQTYYNIKNQLKLSPIYDLLNEFTVSINGRQDKLLDIISREHSRFTLSKEMSDYIIENKDVESQLKELQLFLDGISSVISSSLTIENNGINHFINLKRDVPLAEISLNTANSLINDIELLDHKLSILLKVSQQNKEQKTRIQKDISINMRQRFINTLVNNESIIKQRFNDSFGINIDEIWNKYQITGLITEDNFNTYEDAVIKFETELFTSVYEQKLENEELANKLISLFDTNELYKEKATALKKDTTIVTDYDMLMYLAAILTTPSQNFYAKLYPIISSEEFNKIPIFSQEHAVRIGYSMNYNKELFNKLINKLTITSEPLTPYMQDRLKMYNTYLTFGGAGTGKTTAVGYLLKTLFNENSSFISIAPSNRKALDLSVAINDVNGKTFNKDDFIKEILGRNLTIDDYEIGEGYIKLKESIFPLTTTLFDNKNNKILFIDEVSWFNRPELELISKWAVANNVMVYALGDIKQNGARTDIGKQYPVIGGIEDTYTAKSPNLTATLRPNNLAKNDNYIALNTILEEALLRYEDKPDITAGELGEITKTYLGTITTLKYFETNNQFVGEKFVDKADDIIKYTTKLSKLSQNVAIITDTPSKYTSLPNSTQVISLDNVQGAEFDYVIVDKNWTDGNEFLLLRDVYTLTQRSTLGTIIVDTNNYVRKSLNIASVQDNSVNTNIEIKEKDIKDFKNWRLRSLESIQPLDQYEVLSYSPESGNPESTVQEDPQVTEDKQEHPKVINTPINKSLKSEPTSENLGINTPEVPAYKEISEPNTVKNPESTSVEDYLQQDTAQIPSIPYVESKTENLNEVYKPQEEYIPISDTEVVIDNNTTLEWLSNDLWKYERQENVSSIYNTFNLLGLVGQKKYRDYIYNLAGYFKYGHNLESGTTTYNTLSLKLHALLPEHRGMNMAILKALKTAKFSIIPYNQGKQGLMVAKLLINNGKNIINKEIQIPLFLTINNFGDYTGDIKTVKNVSFESDGEVTKSIDLLNKDGFFTIYQDYIIPVVTKEQIDSISDANTKEYVLRNNGKGFGLITDDPLMSSIKFEVDLHPTLDTEKGTTYLVQSNAKFALFGVQNLLSISETVKAVRDKVTLKYSRLNALPTSAKDERNAIYQEFKAQTNQILYKTRQGELATEIINLAKDNPTVRTSLLDNLLGYLVPNMQTSEISDYKTQRALMFTLEYTNNKTGLVEYPSYLVKSETENSRSVYTLYRLSNGNLKGIESKIVSVDPNPNNIYKLIERIGADKGINLSGYIDPRIFKTYLVNYGYSKRTRDNNTVSWVPINVVYSVDANESVYRLTNGIDNLDILDNIFEKSTLFKNGIYVQDHKKDTPLATYIFPISDSKRNYKTDVTKFNGSIFTIDKSKIIKTSAQENLEDKELEIKNKYIALNKFLRNNNLPEVVKSPNKEIEEAISDLNLILKSQASDITYKQVIYNRDSDTFEIKVENDINNLIFNILNSKNIQFEGLSDVLPNTTLNFISFYVTLQDNKVGYNLSKINGKWDLFEFKSIESYTKLSNYIKDNLDQLNTLLLNNTIDYITNLLANDNMQIEAASNYYELTKNNQILLELDNYVNDYLLDRLKNNEC